jgi:hypothetical protein
MSPNPLPINEENDLDDSTNHSTNSRSNEQELLRSFLRDQLSSREREQNSNNIIPDVKVIDNRGDEIEFNMQVGHPIGASDEDNPGNTSEDGESTPPEITPNDGSTSDESKLEILSPNKDTYTLKDKIAFKFNCPETILQDGHLNLTVNLKNQDKEIKKQFRPKPNHDYNFLAFIKHINEDLFKQNLLSPGNYEMFISCVDPSDSSVVIKSKTINFFVSGAIIKGNVQDMYGNNLTGQRRIALIEDVLPIRNIFRRTEFVNTNLIDGSFMFILDMKKDGKIKIKEIKQQDDDNISSKYGTTIGEINSGEIKEVILKRNYNLPSDKKISISCGMDASDNSILSANFKFDYGANTSNLKLVKSSPKSVIFKNSIPFNHFSFNISLSKEDVDNGIKIKRIIIESSSPSELIKINNVLSSLDLKEEWISEDSFIRILIVLERDISKDKFSLEIISPVENQEYFTYSIIPIKLLIRDFKDEQKITYLLLADDKSRIIKKHEFTCSEDRNTPFFNNINIGLKPGSYSVKLSTVINGKEIVKECKFKIKGISLHCKLAEESIDFKDVKCKLINGFFTKDNFELTGKSAKVFDSFDFRHDLGISLNDSNPDLIIKNIYLKNYTYANPFKTIKVDNRFITLDLLNIFQNSNVIYSESIIEIELGKAKIKLKEQICSLKIGFSADNIQVLKEHLNPVPEIIIKRKDKVVFNKSINDYTDPKWGIVELDDIKPNDVFNISLNNNNPNLGLDDLIVLTSDRKRNRYRTHNNMSASFSVKEGVNEVYIIFKQIDSKITSTSSGNIKLLKESFLGDNSNIMPEIKTSIINDVEESKQKINNFISKYKSSNGDLLTAFSVFSAHKNTIKRETDSFRTVFAYQSMLNNIGETIFYEYIKAVYSIENISNGFKSNIQEVETLRNICYQNLNKIRSIPQDETNSKLLNEIISVYNAFIQSLDSLIKDFSDYLSLFPKLEMYKNKAQHLLDKLKESKKQSEKRNRNIEKNRFANIGHVDYIKKDEFESFIEGLNFFIDDKDESNLRHAFNKFVNSLIEVYKLRNEFEEQIYKLNNV